MTNPKQYRIVLAEDDEDDRFLFNQAVSQVKADVSLKMVDNGEKLLEYLSRLEPEDLPHMIFLDLHLPKRNGIQCIRELRSNRAFNSIPIIMFTTSGQSPDVEASTKFGANMYIRKYDNFATLVNTLNGLLTDEGFRFLLRQKGEGITE
jgi:CheY-like chemotaxis protein